MRDWVEQRLRDLREEFETGQKQVTAIEVRTNDLKSTLFRISGAIQVLEEVLSQPPRAPGAAGRRTTARSSAPPCRRAESQPMRREPYTLDARSADDVYPRRHQARALLPSRVVPPLAGPSYGGRRELL